MALPWNKTTWAQIARDRFGIGSGHAVATNIGKIPGLTPYVPPNGPPPGTYDPSLDFQGENALLGYGYGKADTQRDRGYSDEDYNTALNHGRTHHNSVLGALGISLKQGNEDYDTRTQDLGRSYRNLASSQGQRANAAGVSAGGATAQSATKRAANQHIDQTKLDTAIERFRNDNATQVGNENQSWLDLVGPDEKGGTLGTMHSRQQTGFDTNDDRNFTTQSLFSGQLNPGDPVSGASQLGRAETYGAQQAGLLPTRPYGSYAALGPGETSHLFGGVQYGPGTASNPFLIPKTRPTAQSVGATGSLLGTRLDPRRYRRYPRY